MMEYLHLLNSLFIEHIIVVNLVFHFDIHESIFLIKFIFHSEIPLIRVTKV